MARSRADDAKRGPYRPCPCGSGEKFRFCHGKRAAPKAWSAAAPTGADRTTELDLTKLKDLNHGGKETQYPDHLGR